MKEQDSANMRGIVRNYIKRRSTSKKYGVLQGVFGYFLARASFMLNSTKYAEFNGGCPSTEFGNVFGIWLKSYELALEKLFVKRMEHDSFLQVGCFAFRWTRYINDLEDQQQQFLHARK